MASSSSPETTGAAREHVEKIRCKRELGQI
jgi:hypothetical protein